MQVLRRLGLAARFVSGYLIQLKPDLTALDGPAGTDHDFTDLHAWAEVYIPGAGWIGLDPTSGLFCRRGPHPARRDAALPLRRADLRHGRAMREVDFDFDMERRPASRETPRVTRPFSDDAWEALDALGDGSTRDLAAQDVRLTMGGEPTFVSIDDYEARRVEHRRRRPDQARARRRADPPAARSASRPGGFLHHGQGKWYPGESLPRWTFALYWRKDGEPIWRDAVAARRSSSRRSAATAADALARVATRVAERLGIPAEFAVPGLRGPGAVDHEGGRAAGQCRSARQSKLDDPEERARIARVFDRGLSNAVGYVLPVQPCQRAGCDRRWKSEKWTLRRGRLFLVPGDSPVGFRLPLALAAARRAGGLSPTSHPVDPFDWRGAAAAAGEFAERVQRRPTAQVQHGSEMGESAPGHRRAGARRDRRRGPHRHRLRGARRHPLRLHAAGGGARGLSRAASPRWRTTAARDGLPVRIEGYPPPHDPRIEVLQVTPDPGVIEVNIQPAANWRDCVDDHHRASTRRRAVAGSAPTSSWSTAATPAPAAATMSWSAARRRAD